jgi:hypothetical protein
VRPTGMWLEDKDLEGSSHRAFEPEEKTHAKTQRREGKTYTLIRLCQAEEQNSELCYLWFLLFKFVLAIFCSFAPLRLCVSFFFFGCGLVALVPSVQISFVSFCEYVRERRQKRAFRGRVRVAFNHTPIPSFSRTVTHPRRVGSQAAERLNRSSESRGKSVSATYPKAAPARSVSCCRRDSIPGTAA